MTDANEHETAAARPAEPSLALPTWRLLGTVTGAALLAGGGWVLAARLGGYDDAAGRTGMLGALVVLAASVLGVLAITPWKTRDISLWLSWWLAGVTVRLLVTPLLAFLLYSAASLSATALGLSVGLAYLATLLAEAAVLSRYLHRRLAT